MRLRTFRRNEDCVLVHPKLGQAIISTIAASVAVENWCDVVTESGVVHSALANRQPSAIYEHFIRREPDERVDPNPESTVLQFVFVSKFNFEQLSVHDVAKLSKEREGLYDLKEAVKPLVKDYPTVAGRPQRLEFLKEASELVISEWEKRRASFSTLAKKVFSTDTLMSPDVSNFVGIGAAGGVALESTGLMALSTGGGLIAGIIIQTIQTYRAMANSPYRFLTKLEANGARLYAST